MSGRNGGRGGDAITTAALRTRGRAGRYELRSGVPTPRTGTYRCSCKEFAVFVREGYPLPSCPVGVGHYYTLTSPNTGKPAAPSGDLAIETRDLTKRYGEVVAVDRLTLRVRRGEVYGLLGPNGAGKTTTLRVLLGLVSPTSGEAGVLGAPPRSPDALDRTGALVEVPGLYPVLSGRDNLRVLAKHASAPEDRIEVVLDQVGLADRAGDLLTAYSQGMKQRLGVAAALLKDPEMLILDEPTNGLDPSGIAEMRDLIRELGSGRRTVLLSSHLMGEVEQVCDRVGVIRDGELVKEGTVEELRGRRGLRVRAEPLARAGEIIRALPEVDAVAVHDETLRVRTDPTTAPTVNRALVAAGIAVHELAPQQTSLEEVFLELTRKDGDR